MLCLAVNQRFRQCRLKICKPISTYYTFPCLGIQLDVVFVFFSALNTFPNLHRSMLRKFFLTPLLCTFFAVSSLLATDIRVAFLTDIHVTPGSVWEKGLYQIIDEINKDDKFDFAVITGDLSNRGSDAELLTVKKAFDTFKVPYHVIPGNHESCWSETAGQTYLKIWGNDRFAFRFKDCYFISFSTGPFNKMGDGHVKAEDLHWLDETLKENASDKNTKVIAMPHYPLKDGLGNWPDVTKILKKYNTVAVFCGHEHQSKKMNFDSVPGIMGRPLLYGDDPVPGYNIIEITGDQISCGPKKLGEPAQFTFQFQCGDPAFLDGLQVDPLPEPPGGTLPEKVQLAEALTDTGSIFTGTAVHDGIVYYGNSLGELKAFDTNAKKPLWTVPFGFGASFYSTPLYWNGILTVGTSKKEIVGFNAKSGEILWRIPTVSPIVCDGTIVDGFLYMGLGRQDFCKIDVKTGEIVWTYTGVKEIFQGAPSIAEGRVVFGAWDQHLYCVDAETGKEVWKWTTGKPNLLFSPGNVVPVIGKEQVIVVAPDRFMTALDLKTGREIWRNNKYKVRESMGCSPDRKHTYAKTMDGEVVCVETDAKEFQPKWVCDTGIGYEHVACPILFSNGVVYIGSRDADVVAIDAESGEKLWAYKTGNSAVNRLLADENGNIWFSIIEGKIFTVSF